MPVTIVGLGPGDPSYLTAAAAEALSGGKKIILRTFRCPAAGYLEEHGIKYTTLDPIYEQAEDFDELEQKAAEYILEQAAGSDIIYAVPGSGADGDGTVERLMQAAAVKIIPGVSIQTHALAAAGSAPAGVAAIPASMLTGANYSPRLPLLVLSLDDPLQASQVKLTLLQEYSDGHAAILINGETADKIRLYELDRQHGYSHETHLLVMPKEPGESYDYRDMLDIFRLLRSPEGCPWDRKQTHESLKRSLLEESAELLDAIDAGNTDEMMDELGDVLLQVVFHSCIEEERGVFSMADVIDNLCRKLVLRHPHVFGDEQCETAEDVTKKWDEIKKEKSGESDSEIMARVPKHLSAVMRADKVQSRAAKVGFDWPDAGGAIEKLKEEIGEVLSDYENGLETAASELGNVMFAAINALRLLGRDSETVLNETTSKFVARFAFMERKAAEMGRNLSEMTLDEMENLWQKAKERKQ